MSNKVFQTAYKAQFGRGAESYMFSWMDNTGHIRDTVKLFSSDVTILSRATNLVFVVSFYNAWFACKLDFPVLNQTHLVHTNAVRLLNSAPNFKQSTLVRFIIYLIFVL